MDPGSLNVFACRKPNEDYVFVPGGDLTLKYLPSVIKNKKKSENRYPLAVSPLHSNVRLIAQQGVFTIHGHKNRSIDAFASSAGKFKIRLARIILDRANLHHLWAELEIAGVNRLTLFPELDSVAYRTNWTGQYIPDQGDQRVKKKATKKKSAIKRAVSKRKGLVKKAKRK